eukprot:9393478-Alexandrium_andersonii.AAC.1
MAIPGRWRRQGTPGATPVLSAGAAVGQDRTDSTGMLGAPGGVALQRPASHSGRGFAAPRPPSTG